MSIEFKAAPAKEAELITATAFFTDDKCTTAPVDDSWGLAKFKELSSFSAVTADGKLSFQKWVDADTPYITALTAAEIHVVKKADGVTSAETAAAATGDALWKLTYTATAKDTLCVKFADKQFLQHKIAAGIWVDKTADAETPKEDSEDKKEEEKKDEDATSGAKSMGAAFAAAALAVAATQF